LWFDSNLGKGTTFTVVLPAAGIRLNIDGPVEPGKEEQSQEGD